MTGKHNLVNSSYPCRCQTHAQISLFAAFEDLDPVSNEFKDLRAGNVELEGHCEVCQL
jgi:hypothetical protein